MPTLSPLSACASVPAAEHRLSPPQPRLPMHIRNCLPIASLAFAAIAAHGAAPARPNILFISIDDMKTELGCYGAPQVKTPHLDRFAGSALRFDRAFCQVPTCGASRASLLTSVLPTADRFRIADTKAAEDAPGAVTLPQVFREAGYTTISNGKIFHHADDTAERSWSEEPWGPKLSHSASFDPATTAVKSAAGRGKIYEAPDVSDNTYKDGQTAEKTIADLRRLKAAGKPFFLACGFIRPHLPFYAPKKYWDLYRREDIQIAGNRERPVGAPQSLKGSNEYKSYHFGDYQDGTEDFHRMMRHGYYASTSYVDQLVGTMLTELENLGLAQDTIVVIWGDHGWQLGEHDFWGKHNTLFNAIRVPLIIRVPGRASGQAATGLVALLDLFPTLCELAGLKAPATVQGLSFARLFSQPEANVRDAVYSRYGSGDAIMTADYGFTRYSNGDEMLYDLRQDPQEDRNVVAQPEYAGPRAKLRQRLDAELALAQAAAVPAPDRKARKRNENDDPTTRN
jgi:iduronate 2-sulfatase